MNRKQKIQKLKRLTALRLFGGKCFICSKQYSQGFLFHHMKYKNDLKYKNFRTTEDYNEYIIPIIEKDPERFVLLCSPCHAKIDHFKRGIMNFRNYDKIKKLFFVCLNTELRK